MKKIALAIALALGSTVQPAAFAGSTSGSMPVSLTVTGTCTSVTASALNFGSIPTSATTDPLGQATITVNCSEGTPYTVDLGQGLHYDNTFGERMLSGGHTYDLFSDAARTMIWGSPGWIIGGNVVSASMGAGGTADHLVYGRVNRLSAGLFPGIQTDTVTVTVSY